MASTQHRALRIEDVAPGVFRLRTLMANVYLIGVEDPDAGHGWVLVDGGLPGYAGEIARAGEALFGRAAPAAIVLTHGHFDHVGSLNALLRRAPAPVYAHVLEFPFLTGRMPYPAPDPSVGGGWLARLSPLFPRGPITVGPDLRALPDDGSIPPLPGWQWYHTPGHSPGHVSLFRGADRVLIAGDAVVTVRQESLAAVLMQRQEVRPPPAYYTIDWEAAVESARRIAALDPDVLASGHGQPMRGEPMRAELDRLTAHPSRMLPLQGRYLDAPRRPAADIAVGPPRRRAAGPWVAMAASVAATAIAWQVLRRR